MKNERYQLAGVTLSVASFYDNLLFKHWKWSLNPYKVPEGDSDLTMRSDFCFEEKGIQKEKLILEKQDKFYMEKLYQASDGGFFWDYVRISSDTTEISWYISPNHKEMILCRDESESMGVLPFQYLGKIMPALLLDYGILTLHGVLIEHEGQGIMVCAKSGVGKTTHARLWRDHRNALIINGDRVTLKKEDGKWTGYGLPWSGSSGEQINRSVPIKACILLNRGEENKAEKLGSLQSFGEVLPHIQGSAWSKEYSEIAIDLMMEMIEEIPVYALWCRPDLESVEVLENVINNI